MVIGKSIQTVLINAFDRVLEPVPSNLTRYIPRLYSRLVDLNYRYGIWKSSHSVQGISFHTRHILDVISYENVKDSLLESLLEDSEEGDVLYDVGANWGLYSLCFLSKISQSQVFSFEPNPKVFRHLCTNIELNGLEDRSKAYNTALYDRNSVKDLHLAENPYLLSGDFFYATIIENNAQGRDHFHRDSVECTTKRLDSIPIGEDLSPPDRIKIDVQGAGMEVLRGALETIRKYRPTVYYEIHPDKTGNRPESELERFFDKLNYEKEEKNNNYWIMRP